jgi:SepF-like predicted cell division protein (DUF552 family)
LFTSNVLVKNSSRPTHYIKALQLREISDVEKIKSAVSSGDILIVKITPIARRSVEETKLAINQLCEFSRNIGGDIARLGEERIVITPPSVGIWRSKTSKAASSEVASSGDGS